jgi:HAE1 family hydrophobic/amphiphilic exporter-1
MKDVRSDAESGDREIKVHIDRVRAANVGLTPQAVAQSISIAMRGENLREFRDDSGEIEVRLAFREDDKQSIDQLADLPLYTPEGCRPDTAGKKAGASNGRMRRPT